MKRTACCQPRVLLADEMCVFHNTHDGREVDRTKMDVNMHSRLNRKASLPLVEGLRKVCHDHNQLAGC